jgi:very-short-patch-repair endonuclease
MRYLPYNTYLKDYSRALRNHSTFGEVALWKYVRARSMMGYSFNRQKPLDRYIVDFFCSALNLVIEIDGEYHNHPEVRLKDEERQKVLEAMQLNFLRFSEKEVRNDISNVLRTIEHYILKYEEQFPNVKDKATRKVRSVK